MKRLTQAQIANTIRNLNVSEKIKAELQRQCNNNDRGARFYVYSQYRKQNSKVIYKRKLTI
ncbi:hypothetical protein LCGC14_0458890 [marine sediment metagenome]|uniref:Uncharacterized protein n=1 Tax=marine sediment metagenome TaxID=412755 RepID=A0A0F9V2K4_9ZZZZ